MIVLVQLKCCGVYNGSDFLNATNFNRTNPWWNSNMNSTWQNFTFPLTCCNVGTGFQSNWDSLPASTLESAVSCASDPTGANIYPTVSLCQCIIINKSFIFVFKGCYDKVFDVINSAKTWIIVGAVIILFIEVRFFLNRNSFFLHIYFLVSGIYFCFGFMLS